MRAVDFDPDAWLAAAASADPAKVAKDAKVEAPAAQSLASLATLAAQPLSDDLTKGLARLQSMRPPRITNPAVWPEIVADAIRLANEGWAAQAIDLGWDAMHMFGVEPGADPDPWDYSLAVVMEGWPIVSVEADFITLHRGNATRPFKNRPRPALRKFLWEL